MVFGVFPKKKKNKTKKNTSFFCVGGKKYYRGCPSTCIIKICKQFIWIRKKNNEFIFNPTSSVKSGSVLSFIKWGKL